MKFLLDLVACGGSCTSSAASPQPADEARFLEPETTLLVVPQPARQRVWRKHHGGWQPSLSAISEDLSIPEKIRINNKKVDRPTAEWRRELKRKVSLISQRDRSCSFDHDDGWGDKSAGMIPVAFAPTPFMF